MSAKDKAANDLKNYEVEVRDMCDDLAPELINTHSAPSMQGELEAIGLARNKYRQEVRQFLSQHKTELTDDEVQQWNTNLKSLVDRVNTHKFAVLAKVNQVMSPSDKMTEFEKASIKIQEKQLELQTNIIEAQKSEALAIAAPLKKLLLEKCTDLSDELDQVSVSSLKEGDDQQVTQVVLKLTGWKLRLDSVLTLYQEFLTKTAVHPLPGAEQSEVAVAVEALKTSLTNIISVAEEEDNKRQLYSLDTSNRGEQVKWPSFAGDLGEDFFKFRDDFIDAAKQNKTSSKNQITKLRENLKGYARTLIPASVSDITKALEILEKACGDTMKVVSHRVDCLMKVGAWPQEGSRDCYAKQVKWIIRVQSLLNEIIELADKNEELGAVIFNREKLTQVLKLFPTFMIDKIVKTPGYKKDKYMEIINKLDEWKAVSQNRESILGSHESSKQQSSGPKQPSPQLSGQANFTKPKRLQSCRICKVLEAQGVTVGLFEKHFSDYATGCPNFVAMGTDQRMLIAREARFCVNCMGKDTRFSYVHLRDCPIKKKKSSYSCKKDSCLLHMWLCGKHQTENKEQMKRFDEQLHSKLGIRLTFVTQQNLNNLPNLDIRDSQALLMEPSEPTSPTTLTSPMSYCSMGETGIKRAVRKLHRLNKKKNPDVVTVSPPSGVPLFLFQAIQGINGPVNAFYDKGCSDAVFRTGIPGVELRGTLLNKGPFQMGGVGDITTVAEEEWLVQLNRIDGKKQLVRGVTLNQITCDFPAIETTQAVKEIKASDRENEFLRSCKVPKIAGGKVDILLGVHYSLIQPIPIHELDSGLTIYKSRLVSHDSSENAIIGGPHTSFQFLAERVGNAAALLTHFTDGLQKVRLMGPPKIPVNPLTIEEESFAITNNMREYAAAFNTSCNSESKGSVCSRCLIAALDDDESGETLREIRKLRLEQETGIEMNYRCVKCRDCQSCKNSDRTESLSVREEAEMEMIEQSVSLDLDQKQIICSLPLRREEQQFLTSNLPRAKKVLEQQVRQYGGQPETKELIVKAFKKLFDNGHASFLHELSPDELAMFIHKPIQYFIPWRIAFSDSVTTPARPVLDASARTASRADGTGGKSLNELVCQGKVDSLNLLNLVLNFRVGRYAITGDIQQFYNTCKLIPSQWNLQRFLYQAELDPNSPILEGVIKTLIYGVSSVSAQSECAMKKLGDIIEADKPNVKKLIEKRRYVDDLGDSKAVREDCIQLAQDADQTFSMVNLKCKCWTYSGEDPDTKVSKDGVSISIAGSPWYPKLDLFVVRVPALHFGKRRRGRLDPKTQFFTGTCMEEIDEFCPRQLNRKQVTSKFASIWDLTGKLGPILAEAKRLLSETVSATPDWTSPMSDELRSKWLHQFLLWEKLRGLKFNRAVMPSDAVDEKMRLIQKVDASNAMLNQACWGGFRLRSGGFSCQQILARNLLAPKNSTIPKLELQCLTNGSNMCWLVRKSLEDWIDEYIICGDSIIALCWVTSEKKSLSTFHRNRVIQIRRGTDLERLYHVKTEENLADLGTRPEKVKVTDVGPESEWENGKEWMRQELSVAVSNGILKPVSELRLNPEADEEFKEGLLLSQDTEKFFCNVASGNRVDKLIERSRYSKYLVQPTKFGFQKTVRILAIVLSFINKCRGKTPSSVTLSENPTFKFSVFVSTNVKTGNRKHVGKAPLFEHFTAVDMGYNGITAFAGTQTKRSGRIMSRITDEYIHQALVYLYRRATAEVIKFNPKERVEKVGVIKDGILLSRGRILDGMNFVQTGGLTVTGLGDLNVKAYLPVIDRFSPLAYSVANYIHWSVAKHRGVETCNRMSLENVMIIQGANLYREISADCIRCKMKRRKYIDMPMGLISDHQLKVCPPFWSTQMDIFGPITVYVPGYEKVTRNRNAMRSECYAMVFACPVTRLINLQVIEKKDGSGIVDGITRLACEVGIPKIILMDQDSAFLKSMSEVEFSFTDAEFQLQREYGIEFVTCPVAGHAQHGQVERRIRTVQESLEQVGLKTRRLHATGVQTILKLVENQINNMPLGYSFSNDQDNSGILKIISPNMLRVGRNNSRALSGPMKLPAGGELLDRVQDTYDSWFRIWSECYIPKIMFQPKWWRMDRDLNEGDIVFFRKKESNLEQQWSLGRVEQLIKGRDGLIRRVIVQYQNATEDFKRVTDRHIRSLVRLFSLEDQTVDDDLVELQKRLESSGKVDLILAQVVYDRWKQVPLRCVVCSVVGERCSCCCGRSYRHVGSLSFDGGECGVTVYPKQAFNVGHVDLLQVKFEDVDMDADTSAYGEDPSSCSCSLTAILEDLELNLH